MQSKIFRILDANANRAMEGLRVVEEICRFILEDKGLTLAVKELRGELAKAIRRTEDQGEGDKKIRIAGKLVVERKSDSDVGRKLYTKTEERRKNLVDILRSNLKRVEEALRCLEEFSKLIDPKLGKSFKALRFKVYTLEQKLVLSLPR